MSNLLEQASLVMIPSGYKEDVVYSEIPLDGSGDLSFTRASNGTRINSQGLVEEVPWNLLQQSETFNVSPWVNESNIVTNNSIVAPNGTTTAETISNSNTTALFRTYQGPIIGYAQPQTLTFSTYFKYKDHRYISFGLTDDTDYRSQVVVDLQNMVITENYKFFSGDVLTSSIESVGDGWYRIVCTFTYNTALAGGNLYFLYKFQTSGTFSAVGTYQTGTGFYMWGAQVNIGSTAKPYFPTTDRLNVPRLTYQNGGGGCPSLLLEKQSTNLIAYSNADAGMAFNGTLTLNATTSPEGVSNGFSFLVNANANGGLSFITLTTSAQSYTFSAYLKGSVNGQKVRLLGDLNGTIETFTLTTDWVRYTKTFTGAVGAQSIYLLNGAYFSPSENNLYYGYGMQLEASSYATSLIPTSGSSATRVADECYKTGISSLIGQTEGTLFVDFDLKSTANTGTYDSIINIATDANNSIDIVKNNTTSELYVFAIVGGVIQVNSVGISGTNIQGKHKIAIGYKLNDYVCYLDGVQVFTDTSATVPACSNLYLGAYLGTANQIGGSIYQAVLFKTRLTNSELAQLTA